MFFFFAGSTIGSPVGGRASDRIGRLRLSSIGLTALTLGVVPIALTGSGGLRLLGALIAGMGAGAASGALQAAALDGIRRLRTGRVAGIISSGRYLGAAIGSGVAAAAGVHTMLGVSAALVFVIITAAFGAGITIAAGRLERGLPPRLSSAVTVAHSSA